MCNSNFSQSCFVLSVLGSHVTILKRLPGRWSLNAGLHCPRNLKCNVAQLYLVTLALSILDVTVHCTELCGYIRKRIISEHSLALLCNMAFSARNKTALVTGGGSGICLAFTKLLLSQACNILIADLKLTREAEDLVAANNGKSGAGRVVYKQTDVTDWKQLQAAFDTAIAEFGRLDIICPGAGIFAPVSKYLLCSRARTNISSPTLTSGTSKTPLIPWKQTHIRRLRSTSRTRSGQLSLQSITSGSKRKVEL